MVNSGSVQQEKKYDEQVHVLCRTTSDGEPVERRKGEQGGGRDQRDDKQAQEQQTSGSRVEAAHDERHLYDFYLFPIRQMFPTLGEGLSDHWSVEHLEH